MTYRDTDFLVEDDEFEDEEEEELEDDADFRERHKGSWYLSGYDEEHYQKVRRELDDFDTREYWTPRRSYYGGGAYVDRKWADTYASRDEETFKAHQIVQTFVNAFARDGKYRVVFDPNAASAWTNLEEKKITLSAAPILDASLDTARRGRVLIAMAAHEIAHPRYGRDTFWAVRKAFPNSTVAKRVGGFLDDVRIERAFVDEYPGYVGVHEPAIEYLHEKGAETYGPAGLLQVLEDPVERAIAAVRYEKYFDWSDHEEDRDWWVTWKTRWAPESAPRRHVDAVREALMHIVAQPLPPPLPPGTIGDELGSGQGGSSDPVEPTSSPDDGSETGRDTGSGDSASQDGGNAAGADAGQAPALTPEDIAAMSDEDLGTLVDRLMPARSRASLPTCVGSEEVERAATDSGAVQSGSLETAARLAQEAVDRHSLYEYTESGHKVQVLRGLRKSRKREYNRQSRRVSRSETATRYIRDALMRSRTGHENIGRYLKRGRLDQRGLHRVAGMDLRVFEKKHVASQGRYLVWMMLDHSSSMEGWYHDDPAKQTCDVAVAFADAARHIPQMRAEVWAWSDAFKESGGYRDWGTPGAARAWRTGQPTKDIAEIMDLPYGGTPDSQILEWAYQAILRETRVGETPVILFCSDGQGAVGSMEKVVRRARDKGVVVRSVAIGSIEEEDQKRIYGPRGYVAWRGSMDATARPLASMIARIVTGKER